eukprot:TRINITY_DN962_c0_g2_i2.p1 TRINITY_DN962_c0_g2~~TRINITY_DN962_c0_g2_i2.p1  ORF type:complete len:121 (-),score=26.05 TRINITY_DN962_c0_g2_i2:746-1108(-)
MTYLPTLVTRSNKKECHAMGTDMTFLTTLETNYTTRTTTTIITSLFFTIFLNSQKRFGTILVEVTLLSTSETDTRILSCRALATEMPSTTTLEATNRKGYQLLSSFLGCQIFQEVLLKVG